MLDSSSDPPQKEWRPAPPVTATPATTRPARPGQRHPSKASLEYLGAGHDDVLVNFDKFDTDAVALLRQLPKWARRWDASAGVWRIHPRFAPGLAKALRRLGLDVEVLGAKVTP